MALHLGLVPQVRRKTDSADEGAGAEEVPGSGIMAADEDSPWGDDE